MAKRSLEQLRIAHIVPAPFDPDDGIIGGAERYSFELARYMAERVPTRLISFGDRERTARFRREAQLLASLNHPRIGAIYGLEDSRDVRDRHV